MTRTGGSTPATASAKPAEPNYTSVLVPLDGSELAERALAPAQQLANRFGAALHVVASDVRRDESWWYEDYFEKLRRRLGALSVHASDVRDVADAIVGAALQSDSCLVCMATHGRSRAAAIVGSTFAAVTARLAAPLVAIGPRAVPPAADQAPAKQLAVCLDGTDAAEQALPLAAAWARRLGWRISVITAADPVLLAHEHGFDPGAYLQDVAHSPVFEGLAIETHVLWGMAYPHISIGEHLDRHPVDLVVATTHARLGMARAVLGSEVARIIHRSPAPVLVQPVIGSARSRLPFIE